MTARGKEFGCSTYGRKARAKRAQSAKARKRADRIHARVSRWIMEAAARSEDAWKRSGLFIGKRDGDYIIRRLKRGIEEMKKL